MFLTLLCLIITIVNCQSQIVIIWHSDVKDNFDKKLKKKKPTYLPTLKNVGQSTSNKKIFNDGLTYVEIHIKLIL